MSLFAIVENLLRLTLLLAGVLLPGSMVLRALRLPWSLAASFVCSFAVLYALMLGCSISGAPVTLLTVGSALGVITLLARLVQARGNSPRIPTKAAFVTQLGGWTPLYAVFWAVVGWRLATQPLTGPDVYFRWSWLAEQIVNLGALDFYPPRDGGDFVRYFWPESIPPGIAGIYAWAYLCGGDTHALWTAPLVGLQLLSLHELVWRIGHRWGGAIVARRAVVLAAATPLLTWSAIIGQESGLVAVTVCGLVWCLSHLRETRDARWAVLTGIFAVAAAATREYGLAFAVVGVALGFFAGAPRRVGVVLSTVALPLAFAWPAWVWWLSGNPFHSLDMAGWFPVNVTFTAWSAVFHAPHADALAAPADWLRLGRYLLLWALPALLGAGVFGRLVFLRTADTCAAGVLIVLSCALWFWSLGYTAGGLFYSLRVLSPAMALLAVIAAYGVTAWFPISATRLVVVALALVLTESLPKTLVLPQNPYRTPAAEWSGAGRQFTDSVRAAEQAMLDAFEALPATQRIVTDNAGYPRVFARIGVEAIPLWSPEIAWLFDPDLPAEDIVRRWRQSGLRYFVLGQSASGTGFVRTHGRMLAPYFSMRTVAASGDSVILEVIAPDRIPAP